MDTHSSLIVYPIGTPKNNPYNIPGVYREPLGPIELPNDGIPLPEYVVVNGVRVNLKTFDNVKRLIANEAITGHTIDPNLQVWVRVEKNLLKRNRIVTLFGRDGMVYYVKAQYDPITQSILPPL